MIDLQNVSKGPLAVKVVPWEIDRHLQDREEAFQTFIRRQVGDKASVANYKTPCWVVRFLATQDPEKIAFACGANFFRTGILSSFVGDARPGHHQFNKHVKRICDAWERDFFQTWRPQAVKQYYIADSKNLTSENLAKLQTAAEMIIPNKPARIGYDLDLANSHPASADPAGFIVYFLKFLF